MNILKVITPKRAIGNLGEKRAARFLVWHGYRILERNYVADGAEIDLIAKKGDVLAFVEVKTRSLSSLGVKQARPASSVTPEKQKKIIKAASCYVGYKHTNLRKRFDIIEVYVDSSNEKTRVIKIKHLENTFNINTAYNKNNY